VKGERSEEGCAIVLVKRMLRRERLVVVRVRGRMLGLAAYCETDFSKECIIDRVCKSCLSAWNAPMQIQKVMSLIRTALLT